MQVCVISLYNVWIGITAGSGNAASPFCCRLDTTPTVVAVGIRYWWSIPQAPGHSCHMHEGRLGLEPLTADDSTRTVSTLYPEELSIG
jgi:hypothetical protein